MPEDVQAARELERSVVARIRRDGTFDKFRQRIVKEIGNRGELQAFTSKAVLESKTLAAPGAPELKRRDLIDKLRAELECAPPILSSSEALGVLSTLRLFFSSA